MSDEPETPAFETPEEATRTSEAPDIDPPPPEAPIPEAPANGDARDTAGDTADYDPDEDGEETGAANEILSIGGLYLAMSFLTRLPLGLRDTPTGAILAPTMGVFPLVGVVVGGIGAAVYGLAHQIVPASAAAVLALLATILVTGGLHEDGLADTADGFGGGANRDAKLTIMRDSRIGTYGVLALAVTFALRAVVLAEIGSSLAVAGTLIAAHALARGAIPVAMQALAPARNDGLGATAGQPSATQTGIAITLAVLVTALALPASAALAALAGATIGTILIILLAQAQIGGHTGDVLGAVEQSAETLALLGALAAL